MKNTKTAAVPTVVIDATNIEAIAYNIASDGADQPVDVSLPVPRVRIDAKTMKPSSTTASRRSSPPRIRRVKYTKTAAVPTLVIDATNIEAIADNINV
ncbi:hypothetical protein QYE76_069432 [Lolium multiflorum]|uniref:Uncharacterized protein n=1 Tax=Lolium multiflorum TaxID=4521 RepID=A0AAD8SI79_LOLMU|nr:hypothetical protein QYE76_069432 [Lolium multiflorum]